MAARQLDTSGAAEVAVHLVPALIEHNGPAAVNAYFRPQESGAGTPALTLKAIMTLHPVHNPPPPLPCWYVQEPPWMGCRCSSAA